jgi:hypothetical protein
MTTIHQSIENMLAQPPRARLLLLLLYCYWLFPPRCWSFRVVVVVVLRIKGVRMMASYVGGEGLKG